MTIVIEKLSVAQAATIINAIVTFIQYSISLALVALLLYFIPSFNSANTWSVVARQAHTSLWSTILRRARTHASTRVNLFSTLSLISALLVTICGIVAPLGLRQGPSIHSQFRLTNASFLRDTSLLGLATSSRQDFKFSRICGGDFQVLCPGKTLETINSTEIPSPLLETFSSAPHNIFDIQFRRYFFTEAGFNFSMARPQDGVVESMILQEGIFAIEGMIVDMSETPGVGIINHTIPTFDESATWSQEILWFEPVTTCINTNLTVDYIRSSQVSDGQFNLTDRGGFVNLTTVFPEYSPDGQKINLYAHAYKGAVLGNRLTMMALNNLTRNESFIGREYPLSRSTTSGVVNPGVVSTVGVQFLGNASTDGNVLCQGFGGADIANITNVSVRCGGIVGPTRRTDGGDEKIPSLNSTWSQDFHVCASTTRASIQTVTFTLNSTKEVRNLQITRKPTNASVLWAVEKVDLKITDIDLFWGRVADKYESDPSLWTIRGDTFYVPAGGGDIFGLTSPGQPSSIFATAWSLVYNFDSNENFDYSGQGNFALLTKYQSLVAKDPEEGTAQIRNLIWTDIVANSLVGTETHSTLVAASLEPSVSYDLRFAIPLMLLFIIWVPSFIVAAFLLLSGFLKVAYIRDFLNHTAVGRLALGHSALGPADTPKGSELAHLDEEEWRKTMGNTIIHFRPIVDANSQSKMKPFNTPAEDATHNATVQLQRVSLPGKKK
ncbi:hypothetical protein BDZ94DRAFT_1303903 [Collybia nuda]|uniref:Transmembrane protein n=1 Tax=Collybia nuda TaxID=64659 RepID=A0A9P6CPP2_9AGAR|nr:hypothetical protein BDZ94DRAFT_1303903 [Collybia nuda]